MTNTETVESVEKAPQCGVIARNEVPRLTPSAFRIYDALGDLEARVEAYGGHEGALIVWAEENLAHGDDRLVQIDDPWGLGLTWYRVQRSLDDIRITEINE